MIKKLLLLVSIVSVMLINSQPASAQTTSTIDTSAAPTSEPTDCPICEFDMSDYSGSLNEREVQGLLLALNDEYHAWSAYNDVTLTLGAIRPFTNIMASEAQHISALKTLFTQYNVAIPANPWLSIDLGVTNRAQACVLGVEAEIANVDLYDTVFASTNRSDILNVYQSLQTASQLAHLPAFQRCAR